MYFTVNGYIIFTNSNFKEEIVNMRNPFQIKQEETTRTMQRRNKPAQKERFQKMNTKKVILSVLSIVIGILALVTSLTGCKMPVNLKATELSREDKNEIAALIQNNCFVNYDSSNKEDESKAIFLTIGQMCGCWGVYVDDPEEEKKESYYIDDDSKKYVRDPLKAFKPDYDNGITGYARYDGATVDKLLKGIFNMDPTHDTTPSSFDYDMYYDTLDSDVSLKYYYYKGSYYAEESYGICGNEGYGISFDNVVTDGINYHIQYKRQYASWLDVKSESNPEPEEINNPIEMAYVTVRKNTIDGKKYWSIVKMSNEPYFDFSNYRKDKPDRNWQKLYINQIKKYNKKYSAADYALAFIDGDDIPELIADSGFTADGGEVCTVFNNKINTLDIWTFGASYIEGKNALHSGGGHMDSYFDDVYKIENGRFIKTASGEYGLDEEFDFNDFSGGDIEDYYIYHWNDKKVSKGQYNKKLKNAFDTSLATNPYKNTVSASTMIYRLKNDFYAIYPIIDSSAEEYE